MGRTMEETYEQVRKLVGGEVAPWEGEDTTQPMRGLLTTAMDMERFMLAGNATITLVSKRTGFRWTYRIKKPDDFSIDRPIWFVSVMKGSDNERDFGYIGQIKLARAEYFYERGRKCWPDFFAASDAFAWFCKAAMRNSETHLSQLEVWHEGRCGRCGRKLTVPESVEAGFGPECIGHV